MFHKSCDKCTNEELYQALLTYTRQLLADKGCHDGKKKIYYISAEFLIGKLLSNNLINLGVYDQVDEFLKENGQSLAEIEETEPKRRTWTACRLFPGFYRYIRASRRRDRAELSPWSFQTGIPSSSPTGNAEPLAYQRQLAYSDGCILYDTFPRFCIKILLIQYGCSRIS